MPGRDATDIRRLLVVMPTWFGDIVMATPTLRALREALPDAFITALCPAPLCPLLDGLDDVDCVMPGGPKDGATAFFAQARDLKDGGFDAAVLLPNSARSAMLARLAGIPRRIGYDRDGRGLLLTDRLIPRREGRRFLPVPTLDYYLQLARYLGAIGDDPTMRVAVSDEADARAAELLRPADGRPVVLINPGAQKPEKRWPAERFAELADRCATQHGNAVAVTGSPAEREILDAVVRAANVDVLDLPKHGMDLHTLKAVARRCAALVTNDTGPRHLAAAVGTPVVTLFGPTTPAWTEIGYDDERMVVAVDAGAPASIRQISVDEVYRAVADFLDRPAEPTRSAAATSPDTRAVTPAEPAEPAAT